MPTTITLDGKLFMFNGCFKTSSPILIRRLQQGGGQLAKRFSAQLEALVVGAAADARVEQARLRGIPIIDEAQLEVLLRDGVFTLEDPETTPAGEVIGELRALLDGALDAARWEAVAACLDTADEDSLETLVRYVQDHLSRVTTAPEDPLELLRPCVKQHVGWRVGAGTAPSAWIEALLRGEVSPKHQLIREINLSETKASTTMLKRMLKGDPLDQLNVIELGTSSSCKQTFWAALPGAARASTLRGLGIPSMSCYQWLLASAPPRPTTRHVEALIMRGEIWSGGPDPVQMLDHLITLLGLERVRVIVAGKTVVRALEPLRERLPEWDTLVINAQEIFRQDLTEPLWSSRRLGLYRAWWYNGPACLDLIAQHGELDLLDLSFSPLAPYHDALRPPAPSEVWRRVEALALAPHIKALRLPVDLAPLTDAHREILAMPHVTTHPRA